MPFFTNKNRQIMTITSLLSLLFFWVYRSEIYLLAVKIYPGLMNFSVFTFIFNSLIQDLMTVLIILIFTSSVLMIPERFNKTRYILVLLIMEITGIIIFIALGYFHIFEAPLELSMLGAGLSTFWREILNSAKYEITPRMYNILLLFSLLALTAYSSAFILEKRNRKKKTNKIFPIKKVKILTRIFILFFLPVFLYSVFSTPKVGKAKTKNNISLTRMYSNPVKTVVLNPFKKRKIYLKKHQIYASDMSNFKYGLNTESLVKNIIFPRLHIPRGKKYNIILYFFESTANRYLGMKINGKSVTPNLDRLSRNSFVSKNHYANFPLSVNSLFSVFSSAYDHPDKIWIPMTYPSIKIKTISQILKNNGYRTAVLHSANLASFGHRTYLKYRKIDFVREFMHLKNAPYKKPTPISVDERAMIKPAVKFMKKKKPFFAAVFPTIPHHPYVVTDEKYKIIKNIHKEPDYKKRSWLRYINSLYFADACLGEFVKQLEKNKLLENTLLFIFADHGEAFYQHRQNYLHALFLYEENVRVPFMIYNKKLFPKRYIYKGISRHIDIMTTVLDVLNIKKMKYHEGISLFSAHKQNLAFLHTNWSKDYLGLRDGKWKYILCLNNGREELYNIYMDPDEKVNLAETKKKLSQKFKNYLINAQKYKEIYFKKIFKKSDFRQPVKIMKNK